MVLRALEAFNSGDINGLIAFLDPEVVWEEGDVVFPDLPPVYNGADSMHRWYRETILETWDDFEAELLGIRDAGGGRIVQDYRIRGRGRGSGVEVDMLMAQTMTVRDGRIVHRAIERA